MEEQGERKEEVLVVADSVLEEEEEWGQQHGFLLPPDLLEFVGYFRVC